jgi:hypothetical protein
MHYLSFRFYIPWTKYLMIYFSFLTDIVILVFIVLILINSNYTPLKNLEVIAFITLYVSLSSIFNFLLLKSKTVQTDKEYLYIKQKKESIQKVDINCIDKLERKFHYFYKISFKKECMIDNDLYIFISPNPPFSRPKKFDFITGLLNK